MTCGLMLLAATALLSGTLKSWKLLKDVHDTCVQRQESYVVNSHPHTIPECFWIHKTLLSGGARAVGFFLFFSRAS